MGGSPSRERAVRPLPLVVAAVALILVAIALGAGAVRLGFEIDGVPGPGLLPYIAATVLGALCVWLLFREPRLPDESSGFDRRPLGAIGLLGLFAAAVPFAGFLPATFALVLVWSRLIHRLGWSAAVILALAMTAAGLLLFRGLLGVPLPLLAAGG